eukprot:9617380-Lingulodinium_polyedra.AAC.1
MSIQLLCSESFRVWEWDSETVRHTLRPLAAKLQPILILVLDCWKVLEVGQPNEDILLSQWLLGKLLPALNGNGLRSLSPCVLTRSALASR